LTQAAFCRREGISAGSFYWWKRRLAADDGVGFDRVGRSIREGESFVEVRPARSAVAPVEFVPPIAPLYEVVLPSGRLIRIGERFDPEAISRLIAAVEAAC
jgi:hypothetical protein